MKTRSLSLLILVIISFASSSAVAAKKPKKKAKATIESSVVIFEAKDENTVVLRTSDIESASVTSGKKDTHAGIFIELKTPARKRFQEYTKNHIGKTLNIYIDGKVVASPKIIDEIDSGSLAVDSGMNASEAELVVNRIGNHQKN